MITGLEGIPGSGKSYEASVFHVLQALKNGRKVITNLPLDVDQYCAIDPSFRELIEIRSKPAPIRGTWDANRAEAFMLFDDGHTEQPDIRVSLFGHVWDYYTTWKHPESGLGPLFVIDECHVAMPRIRTDKEVIEWYKLHRHFGCDVLLMTQSFRDIDSSIASLLAVLIRVRKADILGKPTSYIRKVHGGFRGGLISTEERKYKPELFKLYRSHTQSNSSAEGNLTDVKPLVVKWKLLTRAFAFITLIAFVWAFWPKPPKKPVQKTSDMQWMKDLKESKGGLLRAPASPSSSASVPVDAKSQQDDSNPEPYGGKGLHLTGRISMHGHDLWTFAVSNNGQRIASLDSRDLIKAGYIWEPLTDCAGRLRWGGKTISVTCDAPALAQGTNDKPVVLEVPAGGGAPTGSSVPGYVRDLPMPPPPSEAPHGGTLAGIASRWRG